MCAIWNLNLQRATSYVCYDITCFISPTLTYKLLMGPVLCQRHSYFLSDFVMRSVEECFWVLPSFVRSLTIDDSLYLANEKKWLSSIKMWRRKRKVGWAKCIKRVTVHSRSRQLPSFGCTHSTWYIAAAAADDNSVTIPTTAAIGN